MYVNKKDKIIDTNIFNKINKYLYKLEKLKKLFKLKYANINIKTIKTLTFKDKKTFI